MQESKVNSKYELIDNVIDLSVMSNKSIISNSYQSYSNKVKIESIEVIKINSVINKVKNKKKLFELKPHRIIVKQNKNNNNIIISDNLVYTETITTNKKIQNTIAENINSCFIKSLNNNCTIEYIKYYNRGFIKNIFSRRNPNDIINKIYGYDWIFTSKKIANEISKSNKFKLIDKKVNQFNWYGNFDKINIYIDDYIKENEIYAGKTNSILSIINKNYQIEKFNCGNFYDEGLKITIEFTFENNGIKKLIIE
jgi:hypothetical protein